MAINVCRAINAQLKKKDLEIKTNKARCEENKKAIMEVNRRVTELERHTAFE